MIGYFLNADNRYNRLIMNRIPPPPTHHHTHTRRIIFFLFCVGLLIQYLFSDKNYPNSIFTKTQYLAHASYHARFCSNTLELYEFLIDSLDYEMVECDIAISSDGVPVMHHGDSAVLYADNKELRVSLRRLSYEKIAQLSTRNDTMVEIQRLEPLVFLCKQKNVCLMLDHTMDFSISEYGIFYNLICQYGMKRNTLWSDANVYKLAVYDRNLIYQFGSSWNYPKLIYAKLKSILCGSIIISTGYEEGDIESFKDIVRFGHEMGFLMKVSTINDRGVADRFWKIGTDLIITDELLNDR